MICPPCKAAGLMARSARILRISAPEVVARESAEAHAACEAPETCPCQHKPVVSIAAT